jgi:hypothetical protein
MSNPHCSSKLGLGIATAWQNKLAALVLGSAIAAVIYVFDVFPEQQMAEFRSQPLVTESGRVVRLGRQSITVQLAHERISTPTTLPVHVGGIVETRPLKEYPARVVSIRRVDNE